MRIHFIAIGGAVMHNMAIALQKMGNVVSGSDDEIFNPAKDNLARYNLLPKNYGWFPEKISNDIDVIILGMHARQNNPELIEAQKLGLKIYSFPEYVYANSVQKKRVVIAGSHGKTTITSMVMHVLKLAGITFDYLVGSSIKGFDTMVKLSADAPLIIIEGDEYLSSPIDPRPKFHWYKPHIAVINGIAWDHINVFPTFTNYMAQFKTFAAQVDKSGALFYFRDDVNVTECIQYAQCSNKQAYQAHEAINHDEKLYLQADHNKVPVQFIGNHNLINVNAAKHVCNSLGINNQQFYQYIATYTGAGRRLELIAENHTTKAFIDFAHAPSKVNATVTAVKEQFSHKKLIAWFELHTYSSLSAEFLHEYKNTMDKADKAIVVYDEHAAQLKNMQPLTDKDLTSAFGKKDLIICREKNSLQNEIRLADTKNTVYLFMSSGSFFGLDIRSEINTKLS